MGPLPLPSQSPMRNALASHAPGWSRIDSEGALHDRAAIERSCTASRSSCLCCSSACRRASRFSALAIPDLPQTAARAHEEEDTAQELQDCEADKRLEGAPPRCKDLEGGPWRDDAPERRQARRGEQHPA